MRCSLDLKKAWAIVDEEPAKQDGYMPKTNIKIQWIASCKYIFQANSMRLPWVVSPENDVVATEAQADYVVLQQEDGIANMSSTGFVATETCFLAS